MKKYELTDEMNAAGLRRIRYLVALPGGIRAGDLGGWLESEANLSQDGNARFSGDARVCGDARILKPSDWMVFGPVGSRDGFTTICRAETGLCVVCGCFTGTLDEFAAAVEKTHGDNEHGRNYRALIALARVRFGGGE